MILTALSSDCNACYIVKLHRDYYPKQLLKMMRFAYTMQSVSCLSAPLSEDRG